MRWRRTYSDITHLVLQAVGHVPSSLRLGCLPERDLVERNLLRIVSLPLLLLWRAHVVAARRLGFNPLLLQVRVHGSQRRGRRGPGLIDRSFVVR